MQDKHHDLWENNLLETDFIYYSGIQTWKPNRSVKIICIAKYDIMYSEDVLKLFENTYRQAGRSGVQKLRNEN